MNITDIKKIEDPKKRAIQAALCPEVPEHIRLWFALLVLAIGLKEAETGTKCDALWNRG